jgi:DNA repair exonuclease SbcCD ATPase subunit
MDTSAIITLATGIAGIVGGAWGGARYSRSHEAEMASSTLEMLQARLDELDRQNGEKSSRISELVNRVEVLESLVTQRAEVEAVHLEVTEVKGIVSRIAVKVGA